MFSYHSDHEDATFFFSSLGEVQAKLLKKIGKGVIYYGKTFVFALIGDVKLMPEDELKKLVEDCRVMNEETEKKPPKVRSLKSIGKKGDMVDGILLYSAITPFNVKKLEKSLKDRGVYEL